MYSTKIQNKSYFRLGSKKELEKNLILHIRNLLIKISMPDFRKCISFLLLIITLSTIAQQRYEVAGKVMDAYTKMPLSDVMVTVAETGLNTITDVSGKFRLQLTDGSYKLIFRLSGYNQAEQIIDVRENMNITIEMEPTAILLSTFEVYDYYPSLLSQSIVILGTEQIKRTGYSTAGELLRIVPNVNGVRRGGAVLDPVVRGLKFSQLGVYVDGLFYIEGGCPNRMDPTISRVDAHDIERIEVIKGPQSLRYGANLGGAIRLVMHNPYFITGNTLQYRADVFSEATADLGIRQSLRLYALSERASMMLYGGKIDYGNYVDGNGDELLMQAYKYNYGAKLIRRLGSHTTVKATFHQLHGRKVLFPALPMDERSDNTWFSYVELGSRLPILNNQYFSISAYYADVEHIMDNYNRPISDTMAAVSTVYAQTMGIKSKSTYSISNNSLITAIIDIQRIQKDGIRRRVMLMQPPTPSGTLLSFIDNLWNNALIDNVGVYLDYNRRISRHELTIGVRYDLNRAMSENIFVEHPMHGLIYSAMSDTLKQVLHNVSFFGGWNYMITEQLALSVQSGRMVRSPDMNERYIPLLPVGYDRYDYLGNPSLKPEVNYETDVNLLWQNSKYGTMQCTFFYSYIENFITGLYIPPSQQRPLSNGVLGVKQYQNVLQADLMGFEAAYSSPSIYGFEFTLQSALTRGTFWQIKKYIIDPTLPPLQQVIGDTLLKNDPMLEIPPAEVHLRLNYTYRNLKIGSFVRYIAAQNRVSEAFYEPSTPQWLLFDTYVSYYLNSNIEIGAGVLNVFDTYYYEHLNRRRIGSNDKLFEPGRRIFARIVVKI